MDVRWLERLMVDQPSAADAEIERLAGRGDVHTLAQIVQTSRTHAVKLRAIEALGEVAGSEAELTNLVESLNTLVLGGTEQRREREQLRHAAARSRRGREAEAAGLLWTEQSPTTFTPRAWSLPTTQWVDQNFHFESIKSDTLEYRTHATRTVADLRLDQPLTSGVALTRLAFFALMEILREDPGAPGQFQCGLKMRGQYPGRTTGTAIAEGGPFPVVLILPGQHDVFELHPPTGTTPAAPWVSVTGTPAFVREIKNEEGYVYLQEELARHGIIAFAISTNPANAIDAMPQMRADLVLRYLELLRQIHSGAITSPLNGQLDLTRVGLLGHSRGGDAIVKAALDNARQNASGSPPAVAITVPAVCALSPSDLMGRARPPDRPVVAAPIEKFLVVYGSHDGDISGVFGGLHEAGTGFRHYDRSRAAWDAMIFVRGVTHNRFNTQWNNVQSLSGFAHGDAFHRLVTLPLPAPLVSDPTCSVATHPAACPAPGDYKSVSDHQALAKAYIAGFFRWALRSHTLVGRFTGAQFPLSSPTAITADDVALQFWVQDRLIIDNFQNEPQGRSLIGGNTTYTSSQAIDFVLGNRPDGTALAPRVPHQSRALDARPSASGVQVVYRTDIPSGRQDVSRFTHLTFRMSAGFDVSSAAAIQSAFPGFKVRVVTAGTPHEVDQSAIDTTGVRRPKPPFHHEIWWPLTMPAGEVLNVTKLNFQTVVIPFSAFGTADWHRFESIELELAQGSIPLYIDTLCLMVL